MGQRAGKPRASILTFWTKKRLENGLTLEDLSELMKIGYSTLSKELTGEKAMPPENVAKLCELFDVGLREGKRQAKIAHSAWVVSHRLTENDSEDEMPIVPADTVTEEVDVSDSILRKIYGNIPYDDFLTIQENGVKSRETLEILYDKVDFDTFMKLLDVI